MKSTTPNPRTPGAGGRRSDLPFVKASALRKAKIITPDMTEAEVEVGGLTRKVSLWHMHFKWNGGSWSFFICPHCSRKCAILRLYDGRFACPSCDGFGRSTVSRRKFSADRLKRLRATLTRSSLHKRSSLEISLRRALIAQRREKLRGWPPKGPKGIGS